MRVLEKNAGIEHKYPVFAIQFLNTGEVWLMVRPEELTEVSNYIKDGKTTRPSSIFTELTEPEEMYVQQEMKVTSASGARERFHGMQQRKYNKTRSAK